MRESVLVDVEDVTKVFGTGPAQARALDGLSFEVRERELVALVGPSGSGKTTLLNMIGALDVPTSGRVEVLGSDLTKLGRRERADLRLKQLGFVFQAYNLLPVLSARENVELILEMQGAGRDSMTRAREVLRELGLGALENRRPSQLSGGQQQRVAVARAVASRPRLVLADEPTANLDTDNAESLMEMISSLRDTMGMTFVFATHDPRVMRHAERIVHMRDGRIDEERSGSSQPAPKEGARTGALTAAR